MIAMMLMAAATPETSPAEPVSPAPSVTAQASDTAVALPLSGSIPTPRGNPGSWVTTQDYPSSELARRAAGITGFRLAIDAEGIVVDCTVTQSSGSPVLDATACALVKARAQFTPAHDDKGRNTAGFYSNRVRWVMPAITYEPLPDGKWDVTTTVHVSETGTIESCDFASAGNEIAGATKGFTPCTPYVTGRFMRAHRDSTGKPVRYHVIFHGTTEVVPD